MIGDDVVTPNRAERLARGHVDTQAELDSLWTAGVPVEDGRLLVAENLDFMVQTDEDMLALIRVLEIQAGATGSTGIRVKAIFPKL